MAESLNGEDPKTTFVNLRIQPALLPIPKAVTLCYDNTHFWRNDDEICHCKMYRRVMAHCSSCSNTHFCSVPATK